MCGYIFTYMYTKFTGVYTPSTFVCPYIYIHVRQIHVNVCIYLHICMKRHRVCIQIVAYNYRHTCLCLYLVYRCVLYVCVGIYIYAFIHERHHGWIQIRCVRIGIHTYVSVFVRVCVCIHMYTYIYDKIPCVFTDLHICVYILAYVHADFTCGCVDVYMYA